MRKILAVCSVVGLFSFLGTLSVSAAGTPSPPNCQASHGTFTYFSDPSLHGIPGNGQPPYFGDRVLGSAPGGVTGDNNADTSAYCNTL